MNRDALLEILDAAAGVTRKAESFDVQEEHHLTFYVGQPGQAMVVSDVAKGTLKDDFLEVVARESRTQTFLEYTAIHAVATRPPKEEEKRRAGFA